MVVATNGTCLVLVERDVVELHGESIKSEHRVAQQFSRTGDVLDGFRGL